MRRALAAIGASVPAGGAVWGGDWNQPLTGNLAGFSRVVQDQLLAAVEALGLQVPTADLPGRAGTQSSIDHGRRFWGSR